MNNWIVIRSFTDHKNIWFVRVSALSQAADELGLDLSTCECGPVSRIIQEALDCSANKDQCYFAL